MSLLSQASLIVTPNAYKEGKLYSVIPSDGSGDFTFTRATSATRVNAEGLIETASVLGSELVVNGDFATNSIWTTPTGWSISNGTLQGTNANAISATQSGFSFLNKSFKVEYTITEISQGGIKVFLGGSQSTPQRSAVGTYVEYIDITSGNSTLYIYGINFTGKIDNVSVKEVITNNIPRLDYSLGGCPNILLEPQRTNLALQSSSFDSTSWSKTGITVTPNQGIAPDGTMTMDLITFDSASFSPSQAISVTSGATYTFSVWLATQSGTQTVQIGNINVSTFQSVTVTTTPQRFEVTQVASASTRYPAIRSTAAYSIFAWGAQLEAGAYATSYIPTTTASVTRNADVCSKTGVSSLIGQSEGTIFFDGVINGCQNASANLINSERNTNTSFSIGYIKASKRIIAYVYDGAQKGTIQGGTFEIGQRVRLAYAYKSADFALYANGVLIGTSTNAFTFPSTIDDIFIGDSITYFNFQEAITNNATAIWKERLTNDQLAQLTTI